MRQQKSAFSFFGRFKGAVEIHAHHSTYFQKYNAIVAIGATLRAGIGFDLTS
jgi:hypothetical protein